ncbi:hypothetical protein [Capnocytophaga sp. oral taxon 878]|uniref:hypothetical protein n=1 Tax=Capnocytophaga sp. oral taxon 878 TaxID=1316596 RepID=UPI000D0332F7|nr:hypothetical protein [Capnocytophaga sp. oral taxon 878]AVM51017.1 hypothetical protein C4H12_11380 [Capnocytophaga sp. oral taxon 878]
MNYKTLTTLLAFALCLLACNAQERFTTLPKKNWEWLNLHGKVKKLETVKQMMPNYLPHRYEGSGTISSTISFNTAGYVQQIKTYDDIQKEVTTANYVYDTQHNLITETVVTLSDQGAPLDRKTIHYRYNQVGKVIQKDEYINDQYAFKNLYSYDEKGRFSKKNTIPISEKDSLTSQTTYSYNDKYYDTVTTITYPKGKSTAKVFRYKYDNQNNLIEMEYKIYKKFIKVLSTYNENKDEISNKYFSEGEQQSEEIYEYEYDKQHNPIKKRTLTGSRDLHNIKTIKYEYYE